MAAIDPDLTLWDTNVVPRGIASTAGSRKALVAAGVTGRAHPHHGDAIEVYWFASVSDGDTWTSGFNNVRFVAWAPDVANDDWVAPTLTIQATGQVYFGTDNAASANSGWLIVFRGK
jgi:hypothetical protein